MIRGFRVLGSNLKTLITRNPPSGLWRLFDCNRELPSQQRLSISIIEYRHGSLLGLRIRASACFVLGSNLSYF